jgi:hypothetical protein
MIERLFEGRNSSASLDVAAAASTVGALGRSVEAAGAAATSGELINLIGRLEELKSVAAAAQARVTAVFAAGQRSEQRAAGVPERKVGTGIAAQVALARRDSPHRGGQHLGLALVLTTELPHTLAALEAGEISEWRATLVARETACLSLAHRRSVDAQLAARPGGIGALGDRGIAAEARRIAYRLDPYAVTERAAKAAADRRVSLRPAPDAMTWLGALLPAAQGVACYAALTKQADGSGVDGDARTRGQVMADTLVERVTGQVTADAVPVEVHVIMTDHALLSDNAEPAELHGHGPLPAPLVRNWLRGGDEGMADSPGAGLPGEAQTWLRRLYTAPDTGDLVAMDSRRRCFDGQLRRFLILTDRRCRTPWCDAPIRHLDHPISVAAGGETRVDNSQGLCEACNYAKESPGWVTVAQPGRVIEILTPTGHRYTSRPPPPVGHHTAVERASPATREAPCASQRGDTARGPSVLEQQIRDLVTAAC